MRDDDTFPIDDLEIRRIMRNRAGRLLSEALARGKIPQARRFRCVDCGKAATEYDHRDYGKPLDVQPVCHSCNMYRGPAVFSGIPAARARYKRWLKSNGMIPGKKGSP